MPNATPAGACQFIFCFKFVPSLQELVSKLEVFYFDFLGNSQTSWSQAFPNIKGNDRKSTMYNCTFLQ